MGVFDDILKKAPAEDQAILAKYPELRASTEKLESDLAQVSNFAGRWMAWQKQNWDDESGMTKREKALADELATLQTQLTDAERTGSGATAAEIAALKTDFNKKLEEVSGNSLRTIEGLNHFYRSAFVRQLPHQQEFGENLDPQKLLDYMQAQRINDPDVAYDRMVAGRRAEIAAQKQKELETKHAADLEAARQEGYNKRAQELAMGPQGVLPTDSTGGIAGVTARMEKPAQHSDEEKNIIAGAKLGDGTLADLGYAKYRRGDYQQTQ